MGKHSDTGPERSYTIIGMGAIGGYYGSRLAAAGHTVRFLVRSGLDVIRAEGLHVTSPHGDVHVPDVEAYERAEDVPPSDVVVVTVKTTDTDAILADLPVLAGPSCRAVLVMQNGLGVEAPIAAALPGVTVLGGMCFICSHKDGPGRIRHLDYGGVTIGAWTPDDRAGGITAEVDGVADDLERAGLTATRLDDLGTGRWRKLVWNIPYNGLSVVLDAGTDQLMADAATRSLVEDLMGEVVAGAAACGHVIDPSFVATMLADTDRMTPYAPSMKLDHDAGRRMELAAIYAAPTATARAAGAPMLRTEVLLRQLAFLDRRNGFR